MRHMLRSFVEIIRLRSEMNKLFEALQDIGTTEEGQELGFTPPYDIVESPDAVFVEMDLPGVLPDSLQVRVRGSSIVVEGEKARPAVGGDVAYHLMERTRGRFSRHLSVEGAFNTHKARAEYQRGVLLLRIPRVEDRRGAVVSIPIQAG